MKDYTDYSSQTITLEKITALVTSKHIQALTLHINKQRYTGVKCSITGSVEWYKNNLHGSKMVAYARRNGFQFEVKYDPKHVQLNNSFFA
jgi:hypothetical protein